MPETQGRRFGVWAGDPKGVPENVANCIEAVPNPPGWGLRQCARKRGHGAAGLYCGQHAKRHVHLSNASETPKETGDAA